jgi:CheY-like chemotaxis protein
MAPNTPKDILKVAVLGGGITGSAAAMSLLTLAKSRHRSVDVQLYEPQLDEQSGAPALISGECRSRLAALGCRVPSRWKAHALRAFEIISRGHRTIFPIEAADLWVVDDWGGDGAGKRLLSRALSASAALHGATIIPRAVSHVQELSPDHPEVSRSKGNVVIRAQGHSQAVDVAILAGGTQASLGDQFFPGWSGPATLPGIRARITQPVTELTPQRTAKMVLFPVPGVDALWLIPARGSWWACAFGPSAGAPEFCEALMSASRDGALPEGFQIQQLGAVSIPCGAGKNFAAPHRIAVSNAAMGHPWDLSISSRMVAANRAALAVVDSKGREPELAERYLLFGVDDLIRESRQVDKAQTWMRKSPKHAASVFRKAKNVSEGTRHSMTSVLGGFDVPPKRILAEARNEGWKEWFRRLVGDETQPGFPGLADIATPIPEPDLFYVVDDDASTRLALVQFIESQGGRAVAFADELALYAASARRPPRAIVLDVVLSWVDGLQLCQGIKSHPLTRQIPVVVMSGLDLPHLRERALDAGAEAFVPKPVDPRLLWAALVGQSVAARPVPSDIGLIDDQPARAAS